jgi:branched-chain amino acid aminotransferase
MIFVRNSMVLVPLHTIIINDRKVGPWTQRIYDALTAIQWGTTPDPFGWMVSV